KTHISGGVHLCKLKVQISFSFHQNERLRQKVCFSLLHNMTTCVPRLCLYVLGVTVMLGLVVRCDFNQSHFGAYLHGDIVIGILASIHSKVKDLHDRICPEMYTCTDFDQIPFVSSLAAIHTIEEINNSGFLPGIKLGYLMCDPCAYGTKALDCVERMLAVNGPPTVHSDYS
ncbi:hypothetical protein PGIGA_G00098690, partial [Pangasianodon gigas]|nr:hypothetical protein [Pangasianodon gigas]